VIDFGIIRLVRDIIEIPLGHVLIIHGPSRKAQCFVNLCTLQNPNEVLVDNICHTFPQDIRLKRRKYMQPNSIIKSPTNVCNMHCM